MGPRGKTWFKGGIRLMFRFGLYCCINENPHKDRSMNCRVCLCLKGNRKTWAVRSAQTRVSGAERMMTLSHH